MAHEKRVLNRLNRRSWCILAVVGVLFQKGIIYVADSALTPSKDSETTFILYFYIFSCTVQVIQF